MSDTSPRAVHVEERSAPRGGVVVERVSKTFGSATLWRDLSFNVDPGEMIALIGPSGSGKSTLLNCIGLLESVDSGAIIVSGFHVENASRRSARLYRRNTVGYLFQNYALVENESVESNLRLVIGNGESIHDALRIVGLEGRQKEMVYRLSGGEQQRVALARLLIKRPAVVLADEPTGALDSANAEIVVGRLRSLANDGAAVIVATHNGDVESACDRSVKLRL